MALREIVIYPDPRLREVAQPVTTFDANLHTLLSDMAETMYVSKGIGLAAPQVGVLQRVAVVDVSAEETHLIELINPEIVSATGETPSEEGCLSIPDYRDVISRSKSVVVKAQNRKGEPFELQASGLLAICLQHEIDHLNGVLFIDKLSRLKKEMFKKWLKKQST